MFSKAGWWGVSIAIMASATLAATPSNAVGQATYTTGGQNASDAAYCPPTILIILTSNRTGTSRTYNGSARRGADGAYGQVYYSFNRLPQENGTYIAAGTFWLMGWECRMTDVWRNALINVTQWARLDYIEYNTSTTEYGSGCPGREDTSSGDYDPYGDSGEAPVNGGPQCGGGSNGDGGSDPGEPPAAPAVEGGNACEKQWLVVEVSNDGGATWEVWWQGEGYVCQ